MPTNDKNNAAENVENQAICCAENVENHAIFVEGFWPDFYARGRFMKYSMSAKESVCERMTYTLYPHPLQGGYKKK